MAEPAPYVIFRLGRQGFALPLAEVKDVVKAPPITPVPQAEAMVRGLTVLHDQLAAAMDLRARFGLPASLQPVASTALMVEHEGERVALLVDKLEDVVTLGEIKPLSPSRDPLWRGVIAGMVTRNDEALVVLDVAGILDGAVAQA